MREPIDKTNILKQYSIESEFKDKTSIAELVIKSNIYYIYLLDDSGSMWGEKFNNAKLGLIDLINESSVECGKVFTFDKQFEFNTADSKKHLISDMEYWRANNNTPLFKTLTVDIKNQYNFYKSKNPNDKIIINIFTDGEATDDSVKGRTKLKSFLDTIKTDGNTLSMICYIEDKNSIIKLGIDESNILTHDNTASDIANKMNITKKAFEQYRTNVSLGLDVTNNFYKITL